MFFLSMKETSPSFMTKTTLQTISLTRPPIVAVMGHIDHGKSTLLDYIRKTNVVASEAGGITQHISAYEVEHETKEGVKSRITFLDTPGHAAFDAMRERGAIVADVAILVVSAEDGVKPQTLQALHAIREAKIPFVIAITKIDKTNASIERTKMALIENEIYIEGYGGDIPFVPVSSKTGTGIPDLLDMLVLVAELENLAADSTKPGEGFVIESSLDRKKGTAATLIIKDGSLQSGMFVVAGGAIAPVRLMEDFRGTTIKEASPGTPVRIIGFDLLPQVGAPFKAAATKKEAEALADVMRTTLPKRVFPQELAEGCIAIPVIVKGDVAGSVEAVSSEILKLETDRVKIDILLKGVGAISEGDIKTGSASPNTVIIGFSVMAESGARELAERLGIRIELFDVIYKLIEFMDALIKERTPRIETDVVKGTLKVVKTFNIDGPKQVLGGKVISGTLSVGDQIRLTRRGVELGRGKILNLQQSKVDTGSVSEGAECGMQIQLKSAEVAGGDILESISREVV